jgi:hypothetical protein
LTGSFGGVLAHLFAAAALGGSQAQVSAGWVSEALPIDFFAVYVPWNASRLGTKSPDGHPELDPCIAV